MALAASGTLTNVRVIFPPFGIHLRLFASDGIVSGDYAPDSAKNRYLKSLFPPDLPPIFAPAGASRPQIQPYPSGKILQRVFDGPFVINAADSRYLCVSLLCGEKG